MHPTRLFVKHKRGCPRTQHLLSEACCVINAGLVLLSATVSSVCLSAQIDCKKCAFLISIQNKGLLLLQGVLLLDNAHAWAAMHDWLEGHIGPEHMLAHCIVS